MQINELKCFDCIQTSYFWTQDMVVTKQIQKPRQSTKSKISGKYLQMYEKNKPMAAIYILFL